MKRRVTLRFMRVIVSRLLGAAREHQPWLFWNDIHDVEEASREAFDGYPFGESITSIGGALHTWRSRPVDGVVLVLPRGCGPALISEAQLRRASGAPTLFVYNDGDPIDVARLAGFAWRLRSRPARRAAASAAAPPGRASRPDDRRRRGRVERRSVHMRSAPAPRSQGLSSAPSAAGVRPGCRRARRRRRSCGR